MTAEATAPAAARVVGQRIERREDARLVSGRGTYVDDVTMPRMLHATFLRSPVARGDIITLDVSEARALPGVHAVFTAADFNRDGQQFWMTMMGPESTASPMRVFADGDVRYVGEPVALVVAESRYLAEDAIELIDLDIDPKPAIVTMDDAETMVETVHKERDNNTIGELPAVPNPALDEAFASAAHVFTQRFDQHRYLCVPMETRGIVASWDPWADRLEIVAASQSPHEMRLFYSRFLELPEEKIRVVIKDVGGGFGQKMFPAREEHATVMATMALKRPIKWIEDRAENLIAGGSSREETLEITAAVAADGTLLGAKGHHRENVGAFPVSGNGMLSTSAAGMFPGPYTWKNIGYTAAGLYSNTMGHCAYRGPWMMETTGREQMVDYIAAQLGMDPLDLRRRNVIQPSDLPFQTATMLDYQTVSPAETLEQAAELIGYEEFRKQQEAARAEGRYLGIGLSLYIEPVWGFGILGTEAATIRIEPSGSVNVYMGTGSHGQSVETTMAQIVAEELGVPFDAVRIMQGDSSATPYGPGTGGSRTAVAAGGAAGAAATAMKERVLGLAAHLLEAAPDDLEMVGGVVGVKGVPSQSIPLAQVAAAAYLNTDALPPGTEPGLEVSVRYKAPLSMFSNACHACTVEVDPVTGAVKLLRYVVSEDCGNMINPTIVEGQIAGGVVQGIGGVFYENFVFDADGNPQSTTFLDYLLPTAAEVPDIEYGHVVTPANTPGGYKGMGEGGAIASPAALANAVNDALRPLGVLLTAQPLTPSAIVTALEAAGH